MATNNGIPIKELKENITALKALSLCLDRTLRYLPSWSDLAYVLNIDGSIISECKLYLEESPTIKLFEYQSTKRPKLTIQDLKDALKVIQRVDIFKIIDERFKDEDKVSEVITDSSSDILDEIAQGLDLARKPTGNWEKLAQALDVPRADYQKFAMYSDYNPTVALVRYLYTTRDKPILLKDFIDCFQKMGREDVIDEIEKSIKLEDGLDASKVLHVGSDAIQRVADLLNRDIQGVGGWKKLGHYFTVDPAIMDSLEPPRDMEVHSPTTKVISWLAAARPDTTVNDVAKALKKIKHYEALKILRKHFNIDISFDESKYATKCDHFPDLGDNGDTGDDGDTSDVSNTGDDCDDGDDGDDTVVNTKSTTPPDTPTMPRKASEIFSIQATEQSSARIFQGDVLKFGLPSNSNHRIIGRESDKRELMTNLTNEENEMVVVHATPGCGKTTFVVSVAHDITEDPHRYTVVYVDSKHVFSLEDLACKILTTCGISPSPNRPIAQVIELFSHSDRGCVLILENLDQMYYSVDKENQTSTIQMGSTSDQESLLQSVTLKREKFQSFLKEVIKSSPRLKVLVTTWEPLHRLSIKVKTIKLGVFNDEQSLQLLQLRSGTKITNESGLEPIIKFCGGIPLLLCAAVIFLRDADNMEAACEQFASSTLEKQLEFLCPDFFPNEERFSYCLGKCFERMNVCSREVLVLLSVFANAFSVKEARRIAKGSKIDEENLENRFQALKKFCFLNTYDAKSEKYILHPAVRSFGIKKAREEKDLKSVFEPARWRYIFYTFNILSEIEEEFFSTQSRSAIEKYKLQDENIREIARWCITDRKLDVKIKKFCIQSFIKCQSVLLKLMRSYLLKLILREFAIICHKNADIKLYCECLTLRGTKIVYSCLCTPLLCPFALAEADAHFSKVIEALVKDDGNESPDKKKKDVLIYESKVMSEDANAQLLLKYGKCLVRQGHDVEGIDSIQKGIKKRRSQILSNGKNHAMLAMGYEDLAGAYSYKRNYHDAISTREKDVLPIFCTELGMHPFTATAHSQLARNYLELGDYDKALKANEIALKYRKALLGDHQDTARSLFDQGAILSEQAEGKTDQSQQLFEEALAFLREALEMQNRLLDTPRETALTYQELEFVLNQLGKEEEAKQQKEMISKCLEKVKVQEDDLPSFPKSTSQEGNDVSNTSRDKIDVVEQFALPYQHRVFASELEESIRLMKHSIGAIIALNISNVKVCGATCFRIGTKYVITNHHVVDDIIRHGIKWSSCEVDFHYKEEGDQPGYRARFAPNPVLVSSPEKKLDYAILELELSPVVTLPSSVTELGLNIAPPDHQLQDGEFLTLIGHPGGLKKQIDVSCPIKQDVSHPDRAVYDVSTFFKGSSGSPGILLNEKLLVVLHSSGIPTPGGTNGQHLYEYGTLMSSVVKDVILRINNVNLDDIFGGSTSSTFDQNSEPMEIDQVPSGLH